MMDFKNARELLDLCSENHCPISTIMRERECDQGETTSEEADGRMRRVLEIMRSSATEPIEKPGKSAERPGSWPYAGNMDKPCAAQS